MEAFGDNKEGGVMKRVFFFLVFSVLVFSAPAVFSADGRHKKFTKEEVERMSKTEAVIETKFGEMVLRFFPDSAPNHVDNFISLSKKGFYDGTVFHRVIPGFMIQGGDPNSKGKDRSTHGVGGPDYTIKAEFNKRPHKRGILSMARKPDPDSAGSQFFICVSDAPYLDGNYTVFGEVVSGMEVADKIVALKRDERDNPVERVEIKVGIRTAGKEK